MTSQAKAQDRRPLLPPPRSEPERDLLKHALPRPAQPSSATGVEVGPSHAATAPRGSPRGPPFPFCRMSRGRSSGALSWRGPPSAEGSSFEGPCAVVAREPSAQPLHRVRGFDGLLGSRRRPDVAGKPLLAKHLDPPDQNRDALLEPGAFRG